MISQLRDGDQTPLSIRHILHIMKYKHTPTGKLQLNLTHTMNTILSQSRKCAKPLPMQSNMESSMTI